MRAYAKINLGLWIKGRRADGYHELETLFLPLALYDRISINRADSFSMEGPNFGKDDLMYCAYKLLAARYAIPPVKIAIEKNIPVAAGLAGGSADGAAVLRGLRDLYELPLSDDRLREEALSLGADFPYCLTNTPAIGRGIGERLYPVEIPSLPVLLLNPGFQVSTKEAYAAWEGPSAGEAEAVVKALIAGRYGELKDLVKNDLAPGVLQAHPVIGEMTEALYGSGAVFAQMTGSGPTVYGIFTDEAARDAAYAILKGTYTHVISTKTLRAGEQHG